MPLPTGLKALRVHSLSQAVTKIMIMKVNTQTHTLLHIIYHTCTPTNIASTNPVNTCNTSHRILSPLEQKAAVGKPSAHFCPLFLFLKFSANRPALNKIYLWSRQQQSTAKHRLLKLCSGSSNSNLDTGIKAVYVQISIDCLHY